MVIYTVWEAKFCTHTKIQMTKLCFIRFNVLFYGNVTWVSARKLLLEFSFLFNFIINRALPPEKGAPIPIVQEAGWAPEPVWTQRLQEKSFRLCRGSNLDRPVVQPVARHYTDWATRLRQTHVVNINNLQETSFLALMGFRVPFFTFWIV
jgi:hypothetical protein